MISYTSRWLVFLPEGTSLPDELNFQGTKIKKIAILEKQPFSLILVENIIESEKNIQDVTYESFEKMDSFSLNCSYITYAICRIQYIATRPTNFKDMIQFNVVVTDSIFKEKKNYEIQQKDIDILEKSFTKKYNDSFICLSTAIKSPSINEKIVLTHSAAQSIATQSSTEKIITKCVKCNHENDTGRLATNNYIRDEIFNGLKDEKSKKDIHVIFTKLRNKIGHGKPFASLENEIDAKFIMGTIESAVINHLDEKIGFTRNINIKSIIDIPLSTYNFEIVSSDEKGLNFNISPTEFNVEMLLPKINDNKNTNFEFQIGIIGFQDIINKVFTNEKMGFIFSESLLNELGNENI